MILLKKKIENIRFLEGLSAIYLLKSVLHLKYEKITVINNMQLLHYIDTVPAWFVRLRQIIDLRDTDKSRYFAVTEFNNCFIIWSATLFFKEYLREAKQSAIFIQEWSQEGEKRGFIYAWAE